MRRSEQRFPNKYLIFGVLFLLIGGGLLLWSSGCFSFIDIIWPVVLIFLGMTILYFTFMKGNKEIYIFPGMIFALSGLFFLLNNLLPETKDLRSIWPLFMCFAGISIIPYAFRKKSGKRYALLIPSGSIIFLSLVFLPFSLGLIEISFKDFVIRWWPSLFVILGAGLLIFHITNKNNKGKS